MSLPPRRPLLLQTAALLCVAAALQGCVVTTVAGAAVHVAAVGVKTGAKVAGTAVGVTADAAGAVVRTATGGHR